MEEKNKGVKRRKIKNHFPVESVHLYDSHIENKYFLIFHYISILCLCVCVCGGAGEMITCMSGHACVIVCLWRSENNLQESLLFYQHMGSRDWTGSKLLFPTETFQ